jgi:hypothetical protein
MGDDDGSGIMFCLGVFTGLFLGYLLYLAINHVRFV